MPAVKPQPPRSTSILIHQATPTKRTSGGVSSPTSFSNELHPLPPVHLDAQEPTPERLQKQMLDLYENVRRATLPLRQNPAGAPCHVRSVTIGASPSNPQIVKFTHALGRPYTGLHVTRHRGTPLQHTEANVDQVAYIKVTSGGSSYTTPPTVTVDGNATAEAVLANGAVSYIRVTDAGSAYTSPPSVTISGGGGTGATAAATLPPSFDPSQEAQIVATTSGTYDFLLFGD